MAEYIYELKMIWTLIKKWQIEDILLIYKNAAPGTLVNVLNSCSL